MIFPVESDGNGTAPPAHEAPELDPALLLPSDVRDDRDEIQDADRVVLIVEDDPDVARTELEVARERGFKGIVALRGDSGLALAHEYKPDAIILDMKLPVMDGWTVLDHLKHHPETRHIPVHIVSAGDGRQNALKAGAVAFVEKPISKEVLEETFGEIRSFIDRELKRVLVIEDDEAQRNAVIELIGGGDDVEVSAAGSGEEALEALELQRYRLHGARPQASRDGWLRAAREAQGRPALLLDPGHRLHREGAHPPGGDEAQEVRRVDRRQGRELTREAARRDFALPPPRRGGSSPRRSAGCWSSCIPPTRSSTSKKILIVDDDVRNVFALTSVLESHGMEVMYAENGEDGIDLLQRHPEIDLVLMDIMMPGMDGYETMRAIRSEEGFKQLPIISLTAKAMKGDREKSIASGASDYITKPVDTDQLLSLMRVWLYK